MRRICQRLLASTTAALCLVGGARAADVAGVVNLIWMKPSGEALWFSINNQNAAPYCQAGWNGVRFFIPTSDPNYPYYYALLVTSLTKSVPVYIGNISMYSNSAACDITQTGYGLVLYTP